MRAHKICKLIRITLLIYIAFISMTQVFAQDKKMPKDFNFIFHYYYGDELNTINDTFSKDLVDRFYKIKMELSKKEMKCIYQKLRESDFWNYLEIVKKMYLCEPDFIPYKVGDFTITGTNMRNRNPGYILTVYSNNKTHKVMWESCDKKYYESLMIISDYLLKTIENKDEYKTIPKARCGRI